MQTRRVLTACLSFALLAGGVVICRADDAPKTDKTTDKTTDKPSSCVPAIKDKGRHDQFLKDKEELLKKGPITVVFDGDSITDGWRGGGKAVWDASFGKYNPLNLGIGGDRTEHVLWRTENSEFDGIEPKAVVLMIGTNNGGSPADQITAGVICDVQAIHAKVPSAKILLLGIFPRSENPKDPIRDKYKGINADLAKLDGKDNVKFLDIGDKFLDPDGTLPKSVMPDGLHPNAKGYQIWADAIGPTLAELTK